VHQFASRRRQPNEVQKAHAVVISLDWFKEKKIYGIPSFHGKTMEKTHGKTMVKIFPLNQSIDNGDINTNTWGYHQQELGLELCFTQQQ